MPWLYADRATVPDLDVLRVDHRRAERINATRRAGDIGDRDVEQPFGKRERARLAWSTGGATSVSPVKTLAARACPPALRLCVAAAASS
jgi:hypothetical protein